MSTITKKAFAPALLTVSATAYYTCPANIRASFKKVTISNNDTVARLVTIYLVPNGGSAGTTNIITVSQTLSPAEARDVYEIEGHSISALDSLQALADQASKVTMHGTVVETTV
jgi:hypothetical protein